MARIVILPKKMKDELVDLAMDENETSGYIFYKQPKNDNEDEYCKLEQYVITGEGTPGRVESLEEGRLMVEEFLKRNPNYDYIEFHTHSVGTLRDYGEDYGWEFSDIDRQNINEAVAEKSNYIQMLVTPKTTLISGKNGIKLAIVDNLPSYEKQRDAINKALDELAEDLGVKLERE